MINTKRNFNIIMLIFLAGLLSGCIMVEIKKAGVFRNPINYDNKNTAYIDIANNTDSDKLKYLLKKENNEDKITFSYLGDCGGNFGAIGILIPIPLPWYFRNTCEQDGFSISRKYSSGISYKLKYDNKIYNPYFEEDQVKFEIPNFKSFKKAKDKTLIIHKKKPDGTTFTKELPFEWKTVIEVNGGL